MRKALCLKRTNRLTAQEQESVASWLGHEFGEWAGDYEWSVADWHVLVRMGGQLGSHVGIFERTIKVNGQHIRVGGIGQVVTRPGCEGAAWLLPPCSGLRASCAEGWVWSLDCSCVAKTWPHFIAAWAGKK